MSERLMTVAPGYEQLVWTFGDQVPGPVMRVKVGDTVRVHLINPATNMMGHSIDFHASMVAWNDEMRTINPGEELVYEYKANYAGVFMYHCGTAPTLHHIANGMYGMIIVEPKEGLPPVDKEFALVQSEWYLGPQGQVTDLAKAAAGAPSPDFVVFNGIANQYKDNPIPVAVGETVRVFVLNAGPNVDSSFHVVGTIFHDVIKEGIHLAEGNAGNWGVQAVDLRTRAGRDHRDAVRRGWHVPDCHPRLQLREPRRAWPVQGRRWWPAGHRQPLSAWLVVGAAGAHNGG